MSENSLYPCFLVLREVQKKNTISAEVSKMAKKQAQKSPKIRKKMKEKAQICSKDIKKNEEKRPGITQN